VSSNDIRCNAGGSKGVSGKCPVAAGDTVTVEMHQQNGDRGCKNEAIGGSHYGPVMVYMSKVDDSSKADGSSGWFKGPCRMHFPIFGLVTDFNSV
jgi:cellulase